MLAEVQKLVAPLTAGGGFGSVGALILYYHTAELDSEARCAAFAALWQEALGSLPPRPRAGRAAGAAAPAAAPDAPDMAILFARVGALARKPAQVRMRFVRVRVGLALGSALTSACDAAAASLARSGTEHSSAASVLARFRGDCGEALDALHRSLSVASARLSGRLHGGDEGRLVCAARRVFFEGLPSKRPPLPSPRLRPVPAFAAVAGRSAVAGPLSTLG